MSIFKKNTEETSTTKIPEQVLFNFLTQESAYPMILFLSNLINKYPKGKQVFYYMICSKAEDDLKIVEAIEENVGVARTEE